MTTDYGKTWTSIAGGIPDGQPVYVIREDPKNRNLLFLGTEFGVFFSVDAGKQWSSLKLNMPTVAFHDLLIHPRDNDLIAATHGRGIWILDDISALQQATPQVLASDAQLFDASRPATRWLRIQRGGYGRGDLYFKGENPPAGGLVHYFLKAAPQGPATVEITDGDQRKTDVPAGRGEAGHQPPRLGPAVRPVGVGRPDDGEQHEVADRTGAEADRPDGRSEGHAREERSRG